MNLEKVVLRKKCKLVLEWKTGAENVQNHRQIAANGFKRNFFLPTFKDENMKNRRLEVGVSS